VAIPVGLGLLVVAVVFGLPAAARAITHTHGGSILHMGRFLKCWGGGVPGKPAWSSDARDIAFADPGSCGDQIAVINVKTREMRIVTDGPNDTVPDWSPDGQFLLFVDGNDERRVRLATGTSTIAIRSIEEWGARYSPNGRFIAYTHGFLGSPFDGGDQTSTAYVRRGMPDAQPWRIAGHSINAGTPAWSPDGGRIALQGFDGIYVVDRTGANLHRILKRGFSTPGTPSWSRTGKIAFIDDGEVDVVAAQGGPASRVTSCDCSTQVDGVSWSPDGRRLAYSTKHTITIVSIGSGRSQVLVRF
jgi:Tol biopolymer transport system component